MLGWQIFVHSVRMVFGNIPAILRIFWAPVSVTIMLVCGFLYVSGLFNLLEWGEVVEVPEDKFPEFFFLWIIVFWTVSAIMAAWGVTAWHRYVLLEEFQSGPVPTFNFGRALGYFLRLVSLLVISLILLLPVGFVLLAVAQAVFPIAIALLVGVLLIWGVASLRWVLILPAFALDKPLSLSESWKTWDALETPGRTALGIVLVYGAFQFAMSIVVELFIFSPVLYTAFSIFLQLFIAILNVSILTTLYGYIVEKRELT